MADRMKISITKLPSGYWLAGGERLNDWAQWKTDEELTDQHFFAGASDKFRRGLRKRLKWLIRQEG
jgi:predicted alpha/beta superfamily hydrolase